MQEQPKRTLVEIAGDFENLLSEITHGEGEITPELEEALKSTGEELWKKIDAYGHVDARLEQEQEFLKKKADTLYARAKRAEMARERMKNILKDVMVNLGLNDVAGVDYTFKLVKMKDKLVIDESMLPPIYFKQEVVEKVSKELIQQHIDKGEQVPGVVTQSVYSLRKGIK